MGKRREGREAALQYLYQLDLNGREFSAKHDDFWALATGPGDAKPQSQMRAFTEQLVAGVCANIEAVDAQIEKYAANYQLNRIAAVDRNILRIAIYEMLFCEDVPPVVSINEAIEIAKRFGSEESGRFVNGILDRVRAEVRRPPREARPRQNRQ